MIFPERIKPMLLSDLSCFPETRLEGDFFLYFYYSPYVKFKEIHKRCFICDYLYLLWLYPIKTTYQLICLFLFLIIVLAIYNDRMIFASEIYLSDYKKTLLIPCFTDSESFWQRPFRFKMNNIHTVSFLLI